MGKGHAAPTLYSALIRRGFFPAGWIGEYETHVGSRLMTHPSRRYQPGVDASQGALGNLVGIVDANGLSVDGHTRDVMPMEPLADKWRAFGWETVRVDGHDFEPLLAALRPRRIGLKDAPRMVIADTVKGKGVSFMEGVRSWHADAVTVEQHAAILAELQVPLP